MSMEQSRPSYSEIAIAYLEEGYRAWQKRSGASAAAVAEQLGLSVVEDLDFRHELAALGLIAPALTHDDPGDYRLIPRGIALMDGSPTLDSLLALPAAAFDKAAPTHEAAEGAK